MEINTDTTSSFEFNSNNFPPLETEFVSDDFMLGLDQFDFSLDFLASDEFLLSDDGSGTFGGLNSTNQGDVGDVFRVLNSSDSPNCGSCDREGLVEEGSDDGCKVLNSDSPGSSTISVVRHDSSNGSLGFADFKVSNSQSPEFVSFNRESSQDSRGSNSPSADSPNSCNDHLNIVVDNNVDEKINLDKEKKRSLLKRKKENEDENPNISLNLNPSNAPSRRSVQFSRVSENSDNVGGLDDNKKKARLIRNRESAQLSRQRKKHYVEELEDKVKSMHSIITDLNSKISFVMAENVSLRQQLGGPPPGVVYPPPVMGPMHYPWVPYAPYPMRQQGSQVPLVPIPRLKPQQPTPAPKTKKKTESKKSEGRTKKVASVSFLGMLFFMLLFGGLVPFVNVRYGEKRETVLNGLGFDGQPRGRVLTVNGSGSCEGVGVKRPNCRRDLEQNEKVGADGFAHSGNSSEPLVASLYVPRNDKLVKIDGNLIINSVLASERAEASKDTKASTSNARETGLAIAGHVGPALAEGGRNVNGHSHSYRNPSDRLKALSPGSRDTYKDNSKTSAADGSQQKWFREGLAGPIFSSGMCTEVFQFITSPESGKPGGIIPATVVNNSSKHPVNKKMSRRILNGIPIPLPGSSFNGSSSKNESFNGNNSNKAVSSSMVVSVLVDPRDGEGNEVDGVITPPKSFSRIFVVVLIDSVKYVTYSCMLPLKGSPGPHLVTT
ncbi:hypothetical protein GIB67_016917 [Kingdonia uniflora]|uniref:BZIP domain-containing protein n=1 Tax=Kingdonia uniflora TaxID=39325 RepID=A0A7J7M3C7_9MAGN|nr:hypothetical protein GIB67_016917 [Kingdonia uniflora]